MKARRALTVILSVIALILGGVSASEYLNDPASLIAFGNIIVGIVGFAVVLALIPDKKEKP